MSKSKTGIVMEIKNNKACIMTSSGEVVNVKIKGAKPQIGEIFTGECAVIMPTFRNAAIAASLLLFLLTGSAAYAYSIPVASITLSKPSVKVEINRWNRIIKTVPLNDEAKDILNSVNVTNKPLNDGLSVFVDEIKKTETAKQDNKKDSKTAQGNSENKGTSEESDKIVVYVDNNKGSSEVNLKKFEEHASKSNLNVEISKGNDKNNPSDSNKGNKHNNGSNKKNDNKKGTNGNGDPPQKDNKSDKTKNDKSGSENEN